MSFRRDTKHELRPVCMFSHLALKHKWNNGLNNNKYITLYIQRLTYMYVQTTIHLHSKKHFCTYRKLGRHITRLGWPYHHQNDPNNPLRVNTIFYYKIKKVLKVMASLFCILSRAYYIYVYVRWNLYKESTNTRNHRDEHKTQIL